MVCRSLPIPPLTHVITLFISHLTQNVRASEAGSVINDISLLLLLPLYSVTTSTIYSPLCSHVILRSINAILPFNKLMLNVLILNRCLFRPQGGFILWIVVSRVADLIGGYSSLEGKSLYIIFPYFLLLCRKTNVDDKLSA